MQRNRVTRAGVGPEALRGGPLSSRGKAATAPGAADNAGRLLGLTGLGLGCLVADALTAISGASLPLTSVNALLLWPWVRLLVRRGSPRDTLRPRARVVRVLVAGGLIVLAALAVVGKCDALVRAWLWGPSDYVAAYQSYSLVLLVTVVLGILGRGDRAMRFLVLANEDPARLMVVSFGGVALLGGFLLTLPQAVNDIRQVSFLDALFTATSAVCVTGLTVNDVSVTYSRFGQVIILGLVQVGGLGIMVLSSAFAILAGQRLRAKQSAMMMQMVDASSLVAVRRALLAIVGYTLAFEIVGGVLLYQLAGAHPEIALGPGDPEPRAGAGDRLWWAVFHAVSAFCNAGFSLSHGNLVGFARAWGLQTVIMGLIVLGGLGFPVLDELVRSAFQRLRWRRPPRLSLHARVVLLTSAVLTVAPALLLLTLEWQHSLAVLAWYERPFAALFQAVTLRTAGFNTVSFAAMAPATLLLSCVVMFIGASPGSCGGGIKTTTATALAALARSELRGTRPRLFDRQLPESTLARAVTVAVLSVLLVLLFTFLLLLTERHAPLACVFEVVSAFATCGVSTGITPDLSPAGKLVIVAAMLVGRVGPLTLALAATRHAASAHVTLPAERLMIG